MAYRSAICTLIVVSLCACGATPPSINSTDSVNAQPSANNNSRPGGEGVEFDSLSPDEMLDFNWKSLQQYHTIRAAQSLDGKDVYEWVDPGSTEAVTKARNFVFDEAGRFEERLIVGGGNAASLTAYYKKWKWWGSYRIDGQTLELVYRNGDHQKYSFTSKADGIVIDNEFYKQYP